jgi:hypothetical protein
MPCFALTLPFWSRTLHIRKRGKKRGRGNVSSSLGLSSMSGRELQMGAETRLAGFI